MKRSPLTPVISVFALALVACNGGQDVTSVVVSSPGSYWRQESACVLETGSVASPDLTVDENTAFQIIDGFGGAFNEQGWDALLVLDETTRQRALRLLFDASEGLRFLYGRLPIGASDYALDRYTLDDAPGDYALRHFSIDRDRLLLIPYVRAALVHQPRLRIWCWTPKAKTLTRSGLGHRTRFSSSTARRELFERRLPITRFVISAASSRLEQRVWA